MLKGSATSLNVVTRTYQFVKLSVVFKLYGSRVLIKRIRDGTKCAIWEQQCGFRMSRGWTTKSSL